MFFELREYRTLPGQRERWAHACRPPSVRRSIKSR